MDKDVASQSPMPFLIAHVNAAFSSVFLVGESVVRTSSTEKTPKTVMYCSVEPVFKA